MTYFPSTQIIQNVVISDINSSSVNLSASGSFTGLAESTLGVNSIQISLKTDQNCTVDVYQSVDGTNWDTKDSFTYYYSKGGMAETFQAISSYFRVVITNLSSTAGTTFFRLQTVLCPIADPLPRALNQYGNLRTSGGIIDEETGVRAEVDTLGSVRTMTPVRLIGTAFNGSVVDSNFWSTSVTGSGSVTQNGEVLMATGVVPDSTSMISSVSKGRKVPGSSNQFRAVARLNTEAQANNLRRFGCYDANDGFFFQINGTTFGVGARKGTVDTIVNSGSFNGNYGSSVIMDTLIKRLVIEYDHIGAKFFVNGVLLHTLSGLSVAPTNTLNLGIMAENVNSNGNTTDNSMYLRFACISRLGSFLTGTAYKIINTNTTTILKYSSGILHRIVFNTRGTVNNTATIYDGVSSGGTLIGQIDTTNANLVQLDYELTFNTGLTIVTATGNAANMTVVYE